MFRDIREYQKLLPDKKYLIANIFNKDNKDHVIVLYPTNGTGNQTKLLGAAEKRITPTEATVTIKANEIGRTTTVIDGVTYNIVCDEPAAVNDKATLSSDAQVAERTYLEKDYRKELLPSPVSQRQSQKQKKLHRKKK